MQEETIEIGLNKGKITLYLLGALLFVTVGVWFALDPERFVTGSLSNTRVIRILGIVCLSYFGMALVVVVRKIALQRVGLIIDSKGVTDNTNATSIGLVHWDDIERLEVKEMLSQKFIIVHVANPDKYLQLQTSRFGSIMMKANYRNYGSPISISCNTLKIDFKELHELITTKFEKYTSPGD